MFDLVKFFKQALLISTLFVLGSCTKGGDKPKVVNLAIWSNYASLELLKEFEKNTGIRVELSNFSSNEELLAKLQAGASGYDVIVPSDYMVYAMSKLGLLKELDYSLLPNSKSLDPRFLKKSFDPENKHSVPYTWGSTGIAVNRKLFKGTIKSWKDLFENPELKGKFTLLDDVRETIGAVLKSKGYSLNATDPKQLEEAKKALLTIRGRVKAFTSEPMMPLVNGETPVAHAYMTDALQANRDSGGTIDYIIPEEGATLWIDNLAIPANAGHSKEAHALINFLLEGRSNVETVKSVLVAPANKDAFALLSPEIQKNPAIFPPEAVMKKLEMMQDLGDSLTAWDRVWTEVKAGE